MAMDDIIFRYTGEVYVPPSIDGIKFSDGAGLNNLIFTFGSNYVYDPPDPNNISFDFTDNNDIKDIIFKFTGDTYTAPSITSLVFNFGESSTLYPFTLGASICGYKPSQADLTAAIEGYIPYYESDLTSLIKGIGKGQEDISGNLLSIEPVDLLAALHSYDTGSISAALKGYGQGNISSSLHSYDYIDLTSMITGRRSGDLDLPSHLHAYDTYDITSNIASHMWGNIEARLRVIQTGQENITSSIRALRIKDLSASLTILKHDNLQASIELIEAVNLSAILKVYPEDALPASVAGYAKSDLTADMMISHYKDMFAKVSVHKPSDLSTNIYGIGTGIKDLSSNMMTYHSSDLTGTIRNTYLKELTASMYSVAPRDISASTHGYKSSNMSAELSADAYPYDISAEIVPTGTFRDLSSNLKSVMSKDNMYTIEASLSGWEEVDLSSTVSCIPANLLSASIIPIMEVSDLTSEIYPKVIQLTSILSVVTMEHSDISAIINCSYMKSDTSMLGASVSSISYGDIFAKILGKSEEESTLDIGATIGYTDRHRVVNKLPVSLTLKSERHKVTNKLAVKIGLFNPGEILSANITPVLRSVDLQSAINVVRPSTYLFNNAKNNQEVIGVDHYGSKNEAYSVELLFKDIVSDYFYTSGDEKIYKSNKLEKWVVDIKSYFPEKEDGEIKRKLNKIKSLHSMKKFDSIDTAIKDAIVYVTGTKMSDLSSYINVTGGSKDLSSSIKSPVRKTNDLDLACTIQGDNDIKIITLT